MYSEYFCESTDRGVFFFLVYPIKSSPFLRQKVSFEVYWT